MKLRKHMLWPDTHAPYEDKQAVELALKVARDCDEIVILGDFADFYTVSSHSKDPSRSRLLKKEAEYTNKLLDRIEALGKKVTITWGNHEYRYDRYISEHAPELYGLVSVDELFRVKERGWKSIPYMHSHKIGRLIVTHDVGHAGSRAHTQSRQGCEGNIAIGHTHRLAVEYVGNLKGSSHVGAMLGWLGDRKHIDYMHTAKSAPWQLGFGVVYEDVKRRNAHLVPVPIIDYTCVVDGKLYEVKRNERRDRAAHQNDRNGLRRPHRPKNAVVP